MRTEEEIHDLAKELARLIGKLDSEALDLENQLKVSQLKASEVARSRKSEKREQEALIKS